MFSYAFWPFGYLLWRNVYSDLLPYLFIYYLKVLVSLGLCCYVQAFSSCGEQGLLSSCGVWASHSGGFSCCRTPVLGHTGFSNCAVGFHCCGTGLVSPWHVGSSQNKDQNHVTCIGRGFLSTVPTREVHCPIFCWAIYHIYG